jgi:hemolysin activation/secretion protein
MISGISARRSHFRFSLALWAVGAASLAIAQTQPPTAAAGGQIERQFVPEPQPRSTTAAPPFQVPTEPQGEAADEVKFLLRRVDLSGARVIPVAELAAYYEKLIGRQVSLSELNAVARRMTAHYRNAGYLLSQALVPTQSIDDGGVRIEIVEGYVADFRIRGESLAESPLIESYARKVVATRPIDAATLERYLLLMNDLAGVSVRGTLVPARDSSGASTLLLDVARQPFAGGVAVDNRGGNTLGPWRTTLDAQFAGLLSANDRTTLRTVSSWDRKLNYFSLSHEQQVGDEGGKIGISIGQVRSHPVERFFIPLNQENESDSLALSVSYPLLRSRAQNLSLRASLGSHDGKSSLLGVVESEDHVRSARVGFTWDYADSLGGVSLADAEYSQGISGMGSSRNGDPMLSRAQGRVDYSKLSLYLARVQSISQRLSVLAALNAQHAFTDVLSSELFAVGGEQFGRGYDPSELTGDHGLAGKIEVRYGVHQPLAGIQNLIFYGFRDVGEVRQKTPAAGAAAKESLSSNGFGMRLHVSRSFSGFLEWAKPVDRDVASEGDRKPRAFAGVSARF